MSFNFNNRSGVMGPDGIKTSTAEETAKIVAQTLDGQKRVGPTGDISFYVTDVPTRFERVGSAFLGRHLGAVQQISLAG